MKLEPIPQAPKKVKYALTVPQSVLFADLSLQGSLQESFQTAMHINYEPEYILIDNGAMSWNYDADDSFVTALLGEANTEQALAKFINTMGVTARNVDKVSKIISSSASRRKGNKEDIIEDLETYWSAYKLHMTSLFTFWNVEFLLSIELTRLLEEIGKEDEIKKGLARFLKPNEANYFVLERVQLNKIANRFLSDSSSDKITKQTENKELLSALQNHIVIFGFLLAPFNLDNPPSVESLLEQLQDMNKNENFSLSQFGNNSFEDLPHNVRVLAKLAQAFTFWKTERLDILSLCDSRVNELYKETATLLSIDINQLVCMTSAEIIASLRSGSPVVSAELRKTRMDAYCLLLHNKKIAFYQPSTNAEKDTNGQQITVGTTIQGVVASSGVTKGKVRILLDTNSLKELQTGDILVTTMTRPEMGAVLDKAGAFITDEGGLMCHAAIISREMKKPCIIGTENATKILQTGMTVEVDAKKGIVTILELAK